MISRIGVLPCELRIGSARASVLTSVLHLLRLASSNQNQAVDDKAPSAGAKSLCIPHDQERFGELPEGQKCVGCGQPAKRWTMFGRSESGLEVARLDGRSSRFINKFPAPFRPPRLLSIALLTSSSRCVSIGFVGRFEAFVSSTSTLGGWSRFITCTLVHGVKSQGDLRLLTRGHGPDKPVSCYCTAVFGLVYRRKPGRRYDKR
jgi:hypothetical protein